MKKLYLFLLLVIITLRAEGQTSDKVEHILQKNYIPLHDETYTPYIAEGEGRILAIDATLPERLQQALDSVFSGYADSVKRGVSACVIAPMIGVWTGNAGMSHETIPIASNMLFEIASITKTFTAALILQLSEEGKLSLTDPIGKWLPSLNNIDSLITIRELLSQSSGVFDYWNDDTASTILIQAEIQPSLFWSTDMLLEHVGAPRFHRGDSNLYSNTNYLILGLIIESITGNTYSDEIHSRFLEPLGLVNTFVGWDDSVTGEYSHQWIRSFLNQNAQLQDFGDSSRTAILSQAHAAAGIVSTPVDIARWGKAVYEGNSLLSSTSKSSMRTMKTWKNGMRYGLGTSQAYYGSKPFYGHTGSLPGYRTLMFNNIKDSVTICLYFNANVYTGDGLPNTFDFFAAFLNEIYKPAVSVPDKESATLSVRAYPNPSYDNTTIIYSLPERSDIQLSLYNVIGEKVFVLTDQNASEGTHSVSIKTTNLPKGAYTYMLNSSGRIATGQVIVIH